MKKTLMPNGAEILEEYKIPKQQGWEECRIVLCWLRHNECTPFVTWVQNLKDDGCFWGHYYETILQAAQDFEQRCERYRTRIVPHKPYYHESGADDVQSA